MYVAHYGRMLQELHTDHHGHTHCYYLDIPFEETPRRHASKAQADEYGEVQLRDWYRQRDLLPGGVETVLGADSTLAETVDRVMLDSAWPACQRSIAHTFEYAGSLEACPRTSKAHSSTRATTSASPR